MDKFNGEYTVCSDWVHGGPCWEHRHIAYNENFPVYASHPIAQYRLEDDQCWVFQSIRVSETESNIKLYLKPEIIVPSTAKTPFEGPFMIQNNESDTETKDENFVESKDIFAFKNKGKSNFTTIFTTNIQFFYNG